MPSISRRSDQLGTENAFVVLAEVAKLQAAGKDIVSFCIGQPDFPTPVNLQDAAVAAIRAVPRGIAVYPARGFAVCADIDLGFLRKGVIATTQRVATSASRLDRPS